jgi:hypothetical protein
VLKLSRVNRFSLKWNWLLRRYVIRLKVVIWKLIYTNTKWTWIINQRVPNFKQISIRINWKNEKWNIKIGLIPWIGNLKLWIVIILTSTIAEAFWVEHKWEQHRSSGKNQPINHWKSKPQSKSEQTRWINQRLPK